jgi:hypothetical protein
MKCDFCSSEYAKYWYDAQDFDLYAIISEQGETKCRSGGSWLACEHCAELIDKGDKNGLIDWAIDEGLRCGVFKEETIPIVKFMMMIIHERFLENKTGHKNHINN